MLDPALLRVRSYVAGLGSNVAFPLYFGWIVAGMALVGTGNGLVLPRLIGAALTGVTPEQAGIGAAMVSTAQQFASATGVALIDIVLLGVVLAALGYHHRANQR